MTAITLGLISVGLGVFGATASWGTPWAWLKVALFFGLAGGGLIAFFAGISSFRK